MGFGVSHCLLRVKCLLFSISFCKIFSATLTRKTKDLFSIHEQIIETLPYFQMHIFINSLGCRRNSNLISGNFQTSEVSGKENTFQKYFTNMNCVSKHTASNKAMWERTHKKL